MLFLPFLLLLAGPDPVDGVELRKQVLARYDALRSYREEGVSRNNFNPLTTRSKFLLDRRYGFRHDVESDAVGGRYTTWGRLDGTAQHYHRATDRVSTHEPPGPSLKRCDGPMNLPEDATFFLFSRYRCRSYPPARQERRTTPDGREVLVLIENFDYARREIWIDPRSLTVFRFEILKPPIDAIGHTTEQRQWLDLTRIEANPVFSPQALRFRPPPKPLPFRELGRFFGQMLALSASLVLGALFFIPSLPRFSGMSNEAWQAANRLRWRRLLKNIGWGYVAAVAIGLPFIGTGGHPPGVIILIITLSFWTFMAALATAFLAGGSLGFLIFRRE